VASNLFRYLGRALKVIATGRESHAHKCQQPSS